jgi:hypothetical protein
LLKKDHLMRYSSKQILNSELILKGINNFVKTDGKLQDIVYEYPIKKLNIHK